MIESDNEKGSSPSQPQKYEKFLNDVYSSIRQKQFVIKRIHTPDTADLFPKLPLKQELVEISLGEDPSLENLPHKAKSQSKCRKFKSFLHLLDEHQKKISNDNMNLLGLQVKKIHYSSKNKKKELQLMELEETGNDRFQMVKNSKSQMKKIRKTIDCEKIDDFTCNKMGLSHRQIITMNKRNSFNGNTTGKLFHREKPQSGKLQMKRKSCMESNNNPVYDGRINSYRQLLFKVGFTHGVYTEMQKDEFQDFSLKNDKKFKAWIGSGNNGNLIKTLIRRRFWWVISEQKNYNVNFMWTQLKNNDYFKQQQSTALWRHESKQLKKDMEKNMSLEKSLLRKKKKAKVHQEQYFYKVFLAEQKVKYRQFALKHENKCYQEKKEILGLTEMEPQGCKVHNHLINNFYLGNKKALFYNLKQYYQLLDMNVFKRLPLTFHIKKGFQDIQYKRFVAFYKRRQAGIKKQEKQDEQKPAQKRKMKNVWIVKPGELTNRGHGITVIDEIYQLNHIIKKENQHENGTDKTFIVQLYIDRPFLYHKRKFDIRHFILITQIHGLMRAYWYKQGYIRTSSYEFDIENFDREIHLTNDAVQKYTPLYGKYEMANKVSYSDFQRYLDSAHPKKKYNFEKQILSEMKAISIDAVRSSYLKLSPQRLKHNFQIFGLDFMIDNEFKPWLIEVNTNPCLEISSPLLSRIIPKMVDQSLRLSLDVVYPPPCHYPNTTKHLAPDAELQNLNYELIFDEKRDGAELRVLYKRTKDNLLAEIGDISEDEVYEDEQKEKEKEVKLDELL